jgi:hypothetical protein
MANNWGKKIALVGIRSGSENAEELRWDCFDWDTDAAKVNLHDYDTWVLYLPTFLKTQHENSIVGLLSVRYVYKALLSGTEIFIIGDPRAEMVKEDIPETVPFLNWTGYEFEWNTSPGDTKTINSDAQWYRVDEYLQRISEWQYALQSYQENIYYQTSALVQQYIAANKTFCLEVNPLAVNRIGQCISFALIPTIYDRSKPFAPPDKASGRIVLLSVVVQSTPEDSLYFFLQNSLGISLAKHEPEWACDMVAPDQGPLDHDISSLREKIESLQSHLEVSQGKREEVRKYLRLLYEGGPALEEIVRDTLEVLGAQIELPTESNKEDGWIVVKVGSVTYEGVLEIKSTGKPQFNQQALGQLNEWIGRGKLNRGKIYRGIFIGNSSIELPPEQREKPFSDSWVKSAKLIPITALTGVTLFEAYQRYKNRMLDVAEFWSAIFSTDGVLTSKMF